MIDKPTFEQWERDNHKELTEGYREYLEETVLGDENFCLKETEDYWTWSEEEYNEKYNEED